MIHIIYLTTCLINGIQYVGRHKVSSETKKKLSESHIGKDSPMKGKKLSLETKKCISDNHADFSGSKNPMYGSKFIWINNGVINKRHSINTPIPNDWNKGMIYKL